jgi:hypothetical protein
MATLRGSTKAHKLRGPAPAQFGFAKALMRWCGVSVDHPSCHIRQPHWVLRGCGSSSKKREREKKRSAKVDRAIARKPGFEGRCVCRQNILIQRDPRRRLGVKPRRTWQESSFGHLQNGCSDLVTPGLLKKRGSAKIRLG